MQKILEDIELNIRELKDLLEFASREPKIVPIAKRRVKEAIGCLKTIEGELDTLFIESKPVMERSEESAEETNTLDVVSHKKEVKDIVVVVEEPLVQPQQVLGEQLKPAVELSKCFTLNDTFRFSRELFEGETEEMNRVLRDISDMETMADVMSYLSSKFDWDEEDEAASDFIELLKRYFV